MKRIKRLLSILLTLILIVGSSNITARAEDTSAITIKLSKTEGSHITVKSGSGREMKATNSMTLYSGYTVVTGDSSYAYLLLDATKAIKLDENTEVSIEKENRKNNVKLISGSLFFNVTEKLKASESLNIKTSNTTMGIRGTSGGIEHRTSDDNTSQQTIIQLYEGEVELIGSNGQDSDKGKVTVQAGEQLTITGTADGKQETSEKTKLSTEDIPSSVLKEMQDNPELLKKVEENTGITSNEIKKAAVENAKKEQKAKEQKAETITQESKKAEQEKKTEKAEAVIQAAAKPASKSDTIAPSQALIITPTAVPDPITQAPDPITPAPDPITPAPDPITPAPQTQYPEVIDYPRDNAGKYSPKLIESYIPDFWLIDDTEMSIRTDIPGVLAKPVSNDKINKPGYYEGEVTFNCIIPDGSHDKYNDITHNVSILILSGDDYVAMKDNMWMGSFVEIIQDDQTQINITSFPQLDDIPTDLKISTSYACIQCDDKVDTTKLSWGSNNSFAIPDSDKQYYCARKLTVKDSGGKILKEIIQGNYTYTPDNKGKKGFHIENIENICYSGMKTEEKITVDGEFYKVVYEYPTINDTFGWQTGYVKYALYKDTDGKYSLSDSYKPMSKPLDLLYVSKEDYNTMMNSNINISEVKNGSFTIEPLKLRSIASDKYKVSYSCQLVTNKIDDSVYVESFHTLRWTEPNGFTGIKDNNEYYIARKITAIGNDGKTTERYDWSKLYIQSAEVDKKFAEGYPKISKIYDENNIPYYNITYKLKPGTATEDKPVEIFWVGDYSDPYQNISYLNTSYEDVIYGRLRKIDFNTNLTSFDYPFGIGYVKITGDGEYTQKSILVTDLHYCFYSAIKDEDLNQSKNPTINSIIFTTNTLNYPNYPKICDESDTPSDGLDYSNFVYSYINTDRNMIVMRVPEQLSNTTTPSATGFKLTDGYSDTEVGIVENIELSKYSFESGEEYYITAEVKDIDEKEVNNLCIRYDGSTSSNPLYRDGRKLYYNPCKVFEESYGITNAYRTSDGKKWGVSFLYPDISTAYTMSEFKTDNGLILKDTQINTTGVTFGSYGNGIHYVYGGLSDEEAATLTESKTITFSINPVSGAAIIPAAIIPKKSELDTSSNIERVDKIEIEAKLFKDNNDWSLHISSNVTLCNNYKVTGLNFNLVVDGKPYQLRGEAFINTDYNYNNKYGINAGDIIFSSNQLMHIPFTENSEVKLIYTTNDGEGCNPIKTLLGEVPGQEVKVTIE